MGLILLQRTPHTSQTYYIQHFCTWFAMSDTDCRCCQLQRTVLPQCQAQIADVVSSNEQCFNQFSGQMLDVRKIWACLLHPTPPPPNIQNSLWCLETPSDGTIGLRCPAGGTLESLVGVFIMFVPDQSSARALFEKEFRFWTFKSWACDATGNFVLILDIALWVSSQVNFFANLWLM